MLMKFLQLMTWLQFMYCMYLSDLTRVELSLAMLCQLIFDCIVTLIVESLTKGKLG